MNFFFFFCIFVKSEALPFTIIGAVMSETYLRSVRLTKIQISLRIRAV